MSRESEYDRFSWKTLGQGTVRPCHPCPLFKVPTEIHWLIFSESAFLLELSYYLTLVTPWSLRILQSWPGLWERLGGWQDSHLSRAILVKRAHRVWRAFSVGLHIGQNTRGKEHLGLGTLRVGSLTSGPPVWSLGAGFLVWGLFKNIIAWVF
jgi:hypothetical protein